MDTEPEGDFMSTLLRALRRAAILCTLLLLPAASFAGFFISNGQLVDNNGTPFIMRGVNYPYTWFQSRNTQQDLAAIAATGSNTVRVVLSTGGQWARVNGPQVAQIIQWCKDLRMIAVLEVHDSTGWSEQATAVNISNAVQYWTSSDIRAAINGQENFVIVNIANEPFGNSTTANYFPQTRDAIIALRNAGITHNIMIDAANWGQDWSNEMRNRAMELWNADTLRNLTFSVHMYEVYQSLAPIQTYMQAFDDMNLPLVIGEFGPVNNGQPVDSDSVIAQAAQRGNGYIGWSWSGNGGSGTGLDMTNNFDPASLTNWGNRIINGPSGIRATSVIASVFGPATSNLSVSPATLTFAPGASSSAVAVTANVAWTVTDNQGWISVTPTSGTNNGSFSVSVTANTGTTSRSGTVTVTGTGVPARTITVNQASQPNDLFLTTTPASLSFSSGASSMNASVMSNVSWSVTDNQTWITVTPASGSNSGTLAVSVTANTGTASRSGTITVTGTGVPQRQISVTQAAPGNTLTMSASSWSPAAAASTFAVTVTSNGSWSVVDDQSWLSASPTSGNGNGNFTLSAAANTATTSRSGTVTVSGGGFTRTIAVTQAGVSTGGAVTASGLVTSSSGWFSEEQVRVNNTANITALTVTISVQRTAGLNAAGQYNTVGGQITQSNSCTSTVCTYVYTLNSGQTLTPGNGRSFAAQMSGNGTVHPTAGDSFTVTGTAGGSSFSLQGSFQ
jgi:mannan endo-1,4-beta-mannosidase